MMASLVTQTDLSKYRSIAESVKNNSLWEQSVLEAQLLDIKIWLGDELLNELDEQISASPSELTDDNNLLLNGGKYIYQTRTYLFQGLKAVIIYYAFSRFISRSSYNFTQAGVTIKDTDFSTPATDKAIQRLSTEAMLTASSLKDEVILYLRRNSTKYPLFRCNNDNGRPRTFYVIGD